MKNVALPVALLALVAACGGARQGADNPSQPVCGDGLLQQGEGCDDTNTAGGDGCSALCVEEPGWRCTGEPSSCSPICAQHSDCNDNNPCTDDACMSAGNTNHCINTVNTASCDDGLFCNGADTCSGGACAHAGDPCGLDSCNEVSNSCDPLPQSNEVRLSTPGADLLPRLAGNAGYRSFVVVWSSDDGVGLGPADYDLVFARSDNGGVDWSSPSLLQSNAAGDYDNDLLAEIATDDVYIWVVTWSARTSAASDSDIFYVRSIDGGESWTPVATLNTDAQADAAQDSLPHIAVGTGVWVAAWTRSEGSETRILYARSTDGAQTWSSPALLSGAAAQDQYATLAADGSGHWVAAWQSNDTLGDTVGADLDIVVATSADYALSWTTPAALGPGPALDAWNDYMPRVRTDGAGVWVAVWYGYGTDQPTNGNDYDIFTARSLDNGATWSATVPLNSNAASDQGLDYDLDLATDGSTWQVVWNSDNVTGGAGYFDIWYARSGDGGATWTSAAALNDTASTDTGDEASPATATDGSAWVSAWASSWHGGTVEGASDIIVRHE